MAQERRHDVLGSHQLPTEPPARRQEAPYRPVLYPNGAIQSHGLYNSTPQKGDVLVRQRARMFPYSEIKGASPYGRGLDAAPPKAAKPCCAMAMAYRRR